MSSCTTPATQSAAASQAPNPGPSAPPGTISATPATQNDGGCEFVPRLPRETTVDVELYHDKVSVHKVYVDKECVDKVCETSVCVCVCVCVCVRQSVWGQRVWGQRVCGQSV